MSEIKIVWQPLPGSQVLAMACQCNHILYEGTRGPGKTDTQLMRFRRNVGKGYGQFWRGVIFDREYKNLDDLVSKSLRWFPQFGDGAKFLSSKSDYRWVWPTGEQLLFRQIKRASDYWSYHGQEFPFIGWNELNKYPTSEHYDNMMSCNRSSFIPIEHRLPNGDLLPEIPLEVFATTNPYGPGHNWVKRRFINVAKPGQVVRTTVDVFNPRTQKREPITKTQVRLFGSYKENKYLSPEYILELEKIKEKNKRRAWLWGDWDIVAGGALDDVWDADLHVLPRFKVPRTWRLDRSFDWGSAHPFSVGWWAEANGEEAELPGGRTFCPPPGTLIRIYEWYGAEDIGTNKGLLMSAADIARGIKQRDELLRAGEWINGTIYEGPADNQIHNVNEKDTDSIATMMENEGVEWTQSDKRAGSRKNGLQLIRDRLEACKTGEGAGLYVMDNCLATLALLPVVPRDEDDMEDVDTESEDHLYDDVRYRCLSGNNRFATAVNVQFS